MYSRTPVKVPTDQGKLTFRQRGSYTYVSLELNRVYHPERGYNIPVRTVIGRLVDPADRSLMYPNEKYRKHFPASDKDLEPPRLRSRTLKIGAFIALRHLMAESALDKVFNKCFGEDAGPLLDAAACCLVRGELSAGSYAAYAREHPLFAPDMHVLRTGELLHCLAELSQAEIQALLKAWQSRQERGQRVLLFLESGAQRAGDAEDMPVFKTALICAENSLLPLFYERFPAISDSVNELAFLIPKVKARGCCSIRLIAADGSLTPELAAYLDAAEVSFVLPPAAERELIADLIKECGSFTADERCRIQGTDLFARTFKREMHGKERCCLLYFSPLKQAEEQARWEHLRAVHQRLKLIEGPDGVQSGSEAEDALFSKEMERCGYSCLISSDDMTAAQAWQLYCAGREAAVRFSAERPCCDFGQCIPAGSLAEAAVFLKFAAMILRALLLSHLAGGSVRAALSELDKLEITREPGSGYKLYSELTSKQLEIFKRLGLSPAEVRLQAAKLADEISRLLDEPDAEEEKEDFDFGHFCS